MIVECPQMELLLGVHDLYNTSLIPAGQYSRVCSNADRRKRIIE